MGNKKTITIIAILILIIGGAVLFLPDLYSSGPTAETQEPNDIKTGTEPEEVTLPTPRQELLSSDPESVELAAGKLQLIELFAFW